MGKLVMKSTPLSGDPEVKVPSFNFSRYEAGQEYRNDENRIDFVTDEKSLYVCLVSHTATEANVANEQGFLKLVSEGPQGIQGIKGDDGADATTPVMSAEFIGDQLKLIINNKIAALSPSLTGPSWKPVLENNFITWELTNDRYAPESIDLESLRPIQKSPLLLRTNSDNTKRSDETSGPANFIQWKYEGDEYWTNLISISELMNLTLAGVSIWKDETDGKWHFGHREVVKASYDSDKNGRKIISNVRLGDILFDAGELPFAESEDEHDYGVDITAIWEELAEMQAAMVKSVNHVGPDANGNVNVQTGSDTTGFATESWVSANYQPKGNYVTSVNGVAPQPGSNGAITIDVGSLISFDVRLADDLKTLEKTTDGINWTSIVDLSDFGGSGSGGGGGLTENEVKHLIGLILEGVLDSAIENEYVQGNDHNYFIRLNDLSNYATITQVASMIRDAMTDNNVDYYRVFTLYQRTSSSTTAPAKPVVGVWEWNTAAEVDNIALKPNASSAWSNHPENATSEKPYLWMTSATYSYLTKSEINTDNQQNPWENPICLTGVRGDDGADGDSVEFAYILCTETEFNNIKNTTPVAEHGDNRDDDLPTYTTPSGNGWTDHPSGISETYPIEAVIIRTKDSGVWSAYSNPTIWAMWGEDGVDGDGVEYIFAVAAANETSIDPDTGKRVLNSSFFTGPDPLDVLPLTDPQIAAYEAAGGDYQIDDWCPDGTMKHGVQMRDLNWTDNPSDVGPDQPYEFVAIRKKKLDPVSGQMKWGPFTTPALWGFWGTTTVYQPAETHFKPYTCFAFTRIAMDIRNYTVVDPWTYANQSYATWIAADNTREDGYYENPLAYIVTLDENNNVVPSSTLTWSDTIPAPPGQLYMITNHIGDEASGNDQGWTSPRAWGDASGFQVEYAVSSTETDKVYNKVPNYTLFKLDNYDLDTHPNLNDPDNDGIDEAAWRAAVLAAGMGTWGDENDISDPDYMAVCYKKQEGVWSNWQVSRIKGEQGRDGNDGLPGPAGRDGTDIEFIYYRTKNTTKPTISTNAYKNGSIEVSNDDYYDVDDALPKVANYTNAGGTNWSDGGKYWHDNPSGVTSAYKYEWVSCRRSYYSNGVKTWEPFYTPATLWSRYGENGQDGDGVEYVFWDLTEEQATSINGDIYPTQQSTTSGVNSKNRLDSHNRSITDSEYLPAIVLPTNDDPIEAKDDNPGISDQKPYVYASMRKWRYNATAGQHKWGEFSPIKLWLIMPDDTVDLSCTVHYSEDMIPIFVDENYVPKSSYEWYSTMIDMRHAAELKRPASIWIEDTKIIDNLTFDSSAREYSGSYNPTAGSELVYKGVTIKRASFSYGERSYGFFGMSLGFPTSNTDIFANDTNIAIPVTFKSDVENGVVYHGTGTIYLNPTISENPYSFVTLTDPIVYKPSEESTAYSPSTLTFSTANNGFFMSAADAQAAVFKVAFDGGAATTISVSNYWNAFWNNTRQEPGTLRSNDSDIWYSTQVGLNPTPYTLKIIQEVAEDCHVMDRYAVELWVNLTNAPLILKSSVDCYVGTANDPEQDYQKVSVVYPGADGQTGQTGPAGPSGPSGPTGKTVRVSVWESGKNYYDGTLAVDGVYYLDIVTTTAISTNGGSGMTYWKCKSSHTSSSTFASDQSTKWEQLTATTPVITPLVLADKIQAGDIDVESLAANSAFVNNLTVKHLDGADGTFTGGIQIPYVNLTTGNANTSHHSFWGQTYDAPSYYRHWWIVPNGEPYIKSEPGVHDFAILHLDQTNYAGFNGKRFNIMATPAVGVNPSKFEISGVYVGSQGETYGPGDCVRFLHEHIPSGEWPVSICGSSGACCVIEFVYNLGELFAYIISQTHCYAKMPNGTDIDLDNGEIL